MKTLQILAFAILMVFGSACNNGDKHNNKVESETGKSMPVGSDQKPNQEPVSGIIQLEKLPSNIQEYVAKNYPGYTIKQAMHDPLCTGHDAIDVAITKSGSSDYSLIFLPDGTYIQQEEDLNINQAPKKIIEAVKLSYATYKPAQQIERLTLANKTVQYLLDLSDNKTAKEVIFDEEGRVVCETNE